MNCANCKYNDGLVYTSIPAQYRCTITNEYHIGGYNCDVEFAPVQHRKWVELPPFKNIFVCSSCERLGEYHWNYCPHCGAKMDGKEEKNATD